MEKLLLVLKGIAIGIANVIPGVSGGTMAFILGVYDKLTDAIGNFIQKPIERKKFIVFLLLVGIGVAIGIVLFAKIFTLLLKSNTSEQLTYFLFVGLILGSVPFIIKMHNDMNFTLRRGLVFIIAVLMILSTFFIDNGSQESLTIASNGTMFGIFKSVEISLRYGIWLIVAGFLAAGSMVLPGFSGSALLISLGEYNHILQFVDERMILPVALVALGAIPGVVIFAKLINWFLKKYTSETYYFILGLIAASIVQIFNEIGDTISFSTQNSLLSLLTFAIGVIISYFLSKIHK